MWLRESITDGELDALYESARRAWGDDTRLARFIGHGNSSVGQCYTTARWLVSRLGGTVGRRRGHYAWLSPDGRFAIDLTGDHLGKWSYTENDGFIPTATVDNQRTARFIKRADRIFDGLDQLLHLSLDYAGDAFPASEPQAASDSDQFDSYWHDEPQADPSQGEYKFVYANGQLEVSPSHDHNELSQHAGIDPDSHTGPVAVGYVTVNQGKATWEVQSNVDVRAMFRVFKDYTKNVGWEWGGLTDIDGQPINDEFAPKKAQLLSWVHDGHLWLGRISRAELALQRRGSNDEGTLHSGTIRILGRRAEVFGDYVDALEPLYEWATDAGLRLYAGNDNVYKVIPDLSVENLYDPEPKQDVNQFFGPSVDERQPSGLYKCPACDQLFPTWRDYSKHRREGEPQGDEQRQDGGFPHVDDNLDTPVHFKEQQPEVFPVASVKEARRVDGFDKYAKAFHFDNDDHIHYVAYQYGSPVGYAAVKPDGEVVMVKSAIENRGIASAIGAKLRKHFRELTTHAASEKSASIMRKRGWVQVSGQKWKWSADQTPTDMLEASVPFIYDVQNDDIQMGNPGARTSDIPGKFTPGGIIEGNYEPGGKVLIRSLTSIPYTVRHLIQLWYAKNPQLEVKSVHLQDDQGGDTRLAATDTGQAVRSLALADPAANVANNLLQAAGGQVFAVGGAIRDAVMGNIPKDIDLMVTGIPKETVAHLLESLPGRVDFTGKDFGVFRYKNQGHEVEIALPRRDRSTGEGHKDFDVQADHTMTPEEDLYRRDFTANAMAVNLANGQMVDPYGGAQDIADNKLKTLNSESLSDDPLRTVRALVARARHGFEPDEDTRRQMESYAHGLTDLPSERIQAELDKLMSAKDPAGAIRLAHDTGVLKHILPEVDETFGYDQNNPHHERELGDHLLSVLDHTARISDDPDLRMAALLHDIGKPASAWPDPVTGHNHFYESQDEDGNTLGADHETVGAKMAVDRLRQLNGYSSDRVGRIGDLIQNHMWSAFTSPRGARRFLNRVEPHADDLLKLRWADNGGKSAYASDNSLNLDTQRNLIERVRNEGEATNTANLAINGNDLIEAGFQPGPQMGQILNQLTEAVLDVPSLNTRDALLNLARSYANILPS